MVSPDTSNYFGSSRSADEDLIGLTFSTDTITIPSGFYGYFTVQYMVYGNPILLSECGHTNVNCTQLYSYRNNTTNIISNGATTSAYYMETRIMYKGSSATTATLQWTGGTLPTVTTYGDLYIMFMSAV